MEVLYQLSYPGGSRLPEDRWVSDVRGFWRDREEGDLTFSTAVGV
jgi:hypothetical protein